MDLIRLSCYSVKSKINYNERQNCFEIFGYDFIMDCEFNTYLIEVNTNPGYEESSPLIKMLVPRMLDDALRLSIDEIFETKYTFTQYCEENLSNNKTQSENENSLDKSKIEAKSKYYISPYHVLDYSDSLNLWDFVCDLKEKDIFEKKKIQIRKNNL